MNYQLGADVGWATAISEFSKAAGTIATSVSNKEIAEAQADTAKYIADRMGGPQSLTPSDNKMLYTALAIGGGVLLLTIVIISMRR